VLLEGDRAGDAQRVEDPLGVPLGQHRFDVVAFKLGLLAEEELGQLARNLKCRGNESDHVPAGPAPPGVDVVEVGGTSDSPDCLAQLVRDRQ
jgi:hypothetical protein